MVHGSLTDGAPLATSFQLRNTNPRPTKRQHLRLLQRYPALTPPGSRCSCWIRTRKCRIWDYPEQRQRILRHILHRSNKSMWHRRAGAANRLNSISPSSYNRPLWVIFYRLAMSEAGPLCLRSLPNWCAAAAKAPGRACGRVNKARRRAAQWRRSPYRRDTLIFDRVPRSSFAVRVAASMTSKQPNAIRPSAAIPSSTPP